MLAKYHIRLGEPPEQPIVDHGLGSFRRLFRGLEDRHQRAAPRRSCVGEQFGGARKPGHVHIMAAHVRDGHGIAVAIDARHLAGVRQPGRFLDGECVHIGSQHHRRTVAVAEKAHDSGLADARRDFIAGGTQPFRRQTRGTQFLHGEFGMRMNILVEGFKIGKDGAKVAQCRVGRVRWLRIHGPLHRRLGKAAFRIIFVSQVTNLPLT